MQKALFTCLMIVISGAVPAHAAHHGRAHAVSVCPREWVCGASGCEWRVICHRPCPDSYSCSSLYGAYGPYGGAGYWGAYSSAGEIGVK
jgi:hypothetical protein